MQSMFMEYDNGAWNMEYVDGVSVWSMEYVPCPILCAIFHVSCIMYHASQTIHYVLYTMNRIPHRIAILHSPWSHSMVHATLHMPHVA